MGSPLVSYTYHLYSVSVAQIHLPTIHSSRRSPNSNHQTTISTILPRNVTSRITVNHTQFSVFKRVTSAKLCSLKMNSITVISNRLSSLPRRITTSMQRQRAQRHSNARRNVISPLQVCLSMLSLTFGLKIMQPAYHSSSFLRCKQQAIRSRRGKLLACSLVSIYPLCYVDCVMLCYSSL